MAMETLSDSLERLTGSGYRDEYRAETEGLRSVSHGTLYAPESFGVDEVVRFEGDSDPNDEAAVFALSSTTGESKGTLTVGYAALMDPLDADIVRRLVYAAGRSPAPARSRSRPAWPVPHADRSTGLGR